MRVCVCVCPAQNGDFSSLARDRTCALQWKHRVLTTGLPGNALFSPSTTANLPNPLKYILIVWEPYSNPRKGRFFTGL